MKICVISSTVFAVGPGGLVGYGGLEQIAWQQARCLAARGHQVSLIAPEGSSCPGCEIIPTGPPGGWAEDRAYSTYWQRLPEFQAIIDNSWQKWAYVLKQEGRLAAPVLGVLHAPVNTMYRELPPLDKPCFVCISKDQAAHFGGLFSLPARWAWNGIDTNFYRPTGIPRTNRFLFLARFSAIKGPLIAIEACKAAGVGLDLVGDTSITNEPEYFKQCQALCDGKQIRMVGPATRGECVHWFSQAYAMLHPNQMFREPFGLAPVESQACSCPVAAFDFGAMRETVKNGETGWLVRSVAEFTEVVRNLAKNPGIVEQARQNCRDWAMRFSVEQMAARYEELCTEAIETGW